VNRVVKSTLEWLGSHTGLMLIAALLVVLGIWAFIAIADEVKEGGTQRFDEWVVRSLRQPGDPTRMIGPAWLGEVARDVTGLGGVAVLSLVTGAVVGFLWLREKYGAMWLVLVATVGGLVISSLLKHVYERPRPGVVPHLSQVYTTSFPSGHSMLSATVYLTLGTLLASFVRQRRIKFYFVSVAMALTFLVGISRVSMGVHYPTDVLAGWAAGLSWALVCWIVARALQRRGAVEQDIEAPPTSEGAEPGKDAALG
jgi:undecaprenyl-diphosphatase